MFQKFRSHACVKPIARQIKIKSETDIKPKIIIKKESGAVTSKQQKNEYNRKEEQLRQNFEREKEKLIKAYVDQKADNQKITFDLKQKNDECLKLIAAKNQSEKEAEIIAKKVDCLELELAQVQAELANKTAEYEMKMSDLNYQKKSLAAQVKQFQTGISQNDRKDDDVYEVDKILKHKNGKERQFLVRWKGFTAKHDTWERESNLMCPAKLKNYLKSLEKK